MSTKIEKIENFLADLKTEIDVLGCIDVEQVTDFDSITEMIEESNGFDVEIIYYARAMEYLTENDDSLQESLKLADELGYSPGDLNSEILASLLASQNAREEWNELEDEITDFLDSLEEDEEEEDEEEE